MNFTFWRRASTTWASSRWGRVRVRFIDWWWGKTQREARNDPTRMMFTDQRWVDFAPSFFDHFILKDPTYNVAYWNLHERDLDVDRRTVPGERPTAHVFPLQWLRRQEAASPEQASRRSSAHPVERASGRRAHLRGLSRATRTRRRVGPDPFRTAGTRCPRAGSSTTTCGRSTGRRSIGMRTRADTSRPIRSIRAARAPIHGLAERAGRAATISGRVEVPATRSTSHARTCSGRSPILGRTPIAYLAWVRHDGVVQYQHPEAN